MVVPYLTAKDIQRELRTFYGSGNATAIAFEVSAGTGRHAARRVDAVVMDLWPSRGLILHAIEIKVSRSDFKREIKDGAKAEEIAQHCDLFSIAAPVGLLKEEEVPAAWGLIEIGGEIVVKFAKRPAVTKARPVDRLFMASMLRAYGKGPAADLSKERSKLYEGFRTEVDREAELRQVRNVEDAKRWREIEALVGDVGYFKDREIVEAVRLLVKSGVLRTYDGMDKLEHDAREFADRISTIRASMTKVKRERLD